MLVNRKERGTEVAKVLGDKNNVALMRGHGNVVVGSNIQNVVWRAYYTEVNARMLATALAIGGGAGGISFAGGSGDHRRIDAAGRGAALEALEGKGARRLIENNGGRRRAQVGETNVREQSQLRVRSHVHC